MKTEARKGKEAGCAPGWKKHKTGEARGRPSWRSSFLGDPGAKVFCRTRGNGPNQEETGKKERSDPSAYGRHVPAQIQRLQDEESSERSVEFFSSLAEAVAAARSGPGRAVFWRGESAPWTARTAAKESAREEKTCSQECKISVTTEATMMSKNASTPNSGPISKNPQLAEGQLEPLFRRLNLAHTRRIYQDVADRAEKENWSYRDFLALLLAEEVAHRKQTRLQRCTRQAHFPFFKTIDEFDFSLQTTLRQSLLGSYLGPDFVTEGRSLILYGKTGRGKTHLAVAIGYRAIQNGFETFCTTAAELVEHLANTSQKGRLQESLLTYTRPHVLLVDEVGYLTYGPDAANVLFHVVNDRHLRKRPMIFTTNKPLSEWGKVLHDEDLAAAILDRILERGRLIHLDGPSGRTRHLNLEEVLPAAAERARISGIRVPEFPEPT
jgi:DNA replication protein DnaC